MNSSLPSTTTKPLECCNRLRPWILGIAFLGVTSVFGADDGSVRQIQNIFDPKSAPAESLFRISVLTLLICAVIFLIVAGLLIYAVVVFRQRPDTDNTTEPPQVYGSAAIELAWTIPPILIVVVLVLVTARTIGEIERPTMPKRTEKVTVIGHRFWWELRYPEYGVVAANELHVPLSDRKARTPTELALESADVIHGWWVAQLNGKTQAVPNRRNTTWIEPYETGIYVGNCTVFCGTQHANMLIRVVVETPEKFRAWIDSQKASPTTAPAVAKGGNEFVKSSCGSCHRIDKTENKGVFGPDLTHYGSRQTIGSGVAPNTDENLKSWLADPQVLKPGCLMPNMQLDREQINQIAAYLRSLQ